MAGPRSPLRFVLLLSLLALKVFVDSPSVLPALAGESAADLSTSIDDDDFDSSSGVAVPSLTTEQEVHRTQEALDPEVVDLGKPSPYAEEESGILAASASRLNFSPMMALKSFFHMGGETGAPGHRSRIDVVKNAAMDHVHRLLQMLRESSEDEEERLLFADRREKKVITVNEWYTTTVAATMLGRRPTDEDAILVSAPATSRPNVRIKAVFDGHAGEATSQYCAKHAAKHLGKLSEFTFAEVKKACLSLDAEIIRKLGPKHVAGSTGIIVAIERLSAPVVENVVGREIVPRAHEETFVPLEKLIQEEEEAEHPELVGRYPRVPDVQQKTIPAGSFLVTAINIGDSRATLIHSDGGLTRLSKDHKPNHPTEASRIEKAGGSVETFDVPRVDGVLALSRAFGDSDFKMNPNLPPEEQKVIAVPDVRQFYALSSDLLLLACDGVYEPSGMDWAYVRDLTVAEMQRSKGDLEEVAARVMDYAYDMNSQDNISVMLVAFHNQEVEHPTAVYKVVSGQGVVLSETRRPSDAEDDSVEGDTVSLF
ncbi:protein phosphatase 2C domain-containing protein [Toxoplasma gondii TgCatPRC2]|uniref:protein-serine/threonine phosphatase n=3 Tax=Toxoplasma gondii TaxID=5811 RepID=A0A151HNT4_TOXGO|nr:protein phosphatase 2C domain-containing protein [Toxoplasma gondii ME49]ABV44288.1 protein phosphatase 2C2 [Toxoplasma gondii]EPT28413.1 protein phosphatase 2C domain-containing protein [Toxoplasma gondii ME49]KYK71026.1 protein phosphatase 2C domain-containing protein [Toxoplasma gondii TgCatPRC2]|eukprot:XP_002365708.1 protein phosphatase 2C domain-containing protein [Toxoplasma gondii ME49]